MQDWTTALKEIGPLKQEFFEKARRRLDCLTKPQNSLGRLEEIAARYVAITEDPLPQQVRKRVVVFAADHGVVEEGVSAYPQEVTAQMVLNFVRGGAAINVLGRGAGASVTVVDVGVNHDFADVDGLVVRKVRHGTRNFLKEDAMTRSETIEAITIGIALATQAYEDGITLIGTGEMGIGNTTASSAILSVIMGCSVATVTGSGTGLSSEQRLQKIDVIERGIRHRTESLYDPLGILSALGGYGIAAITGLIIGAACRRMAIVVDGLISSAAALVAIEMNPLIQRYLFFAHESKEPGHGRLLEYLQSSPLLRLDMALGEGTGAVLAMSIIDASLRVYREMATFDAAGVSKKSEQ